MTNVTEAPAVSTEDATERRDEIAVINGDDIRDAARCIRQLEDETLLNAGGRFVSLAAGGAGLNYLCALEPKRITFFDPSQDALDWLRFLLHLIQASPNRLAFITSLFARPAETLPSTLDEAENFMRQPGSPDLWQLVHDGINDDALAAVHDYYGRILMEAPAGTMIMPFGRCSGLSVPEFSDSNFISLMQDPDMAYPENYRCLNLNEGWLASEKTYSLTRKILKAADVEFMKSSLRDLPIATLTEKEDWTYVYVSNLNGTDPEEWIATLIHWKVRCIAAFPLNRVVVLTAFDGAADVINDQLSKLDLNRSSRMNRLMAGRSAHFRAWHAVRLRLRGKRICELVHDQSIGFSEIDREQRLFKDFLDADDTYDTVIMHRPLTTGVDADTVLACIDQALKMHARVILMDHNPGCEEFISGQAITPDLTPMDAWWTLDDAVEKIKPLLAKKTVVETFHTGNFKDNNRNWFMVLDSEPVVLGKVLAERGLDTLVNELREDHMKRYKVTVLSQYAAKAFKEKDYDSVVLAALEAHFMAPADMAVTELYCWAMCYIGQPDLAATALSLAARMRGAVCEELRELAAKFGFTLRPAEPLNP